MVNIFSLNAIAFLVLFTCLPALSSPLAGEVISICDDGGEWPPYTYYERNEDGKTDRIIGFSVAVVREIFDQAGIAFTIELPPWKRCLHELLRGKKYQMALSASYSKERDEAYLLSKSYYSTTKHVFYSRQKYPDGLSVASASELKRFKIGGILGHNFESYGIKNDLVTVKTGSYDQLLKMLYSNRFEIFLAEYEILLGLSKIDSTIKLDSKLGYSPLSNLEKNQFYMLISRGYEKAPELKKIIDEGIKRLRKSGALVNLLNAYE